MFSVLTWNVENLFRPSQTSTPEEQQHYQDKLTLLADVIRLHNPDVIALQEVGGLEPLSDLQIACGYPHRDISNFPDKRHIRVAFLSNLPIIAREDIVDFPVGPASTIFDLTATGTVPITRMSRGALRIRVQHQGMTIDVITAHLKSKLLSFPRIGGSSFQPRNEDERAQVAGIAILKRSAEAVTLRDRINDFLEANVDNPLILCGDFNDVPEAQTSLILCGPPGSEIGTRGFKMADLGDDQRLFNLTNAIQDPARRHSRIHNGRGEMLDQIYASEELVPLINNLRVLPIVDSLVDFRGQLPSVTNNPLLRVDDIGPDHAPVIAVFDI